MESLKPVKKLNFASDYMEGAHEAVLRRLSAENLIKHDGYGTDSICAAAAGKILAACGCPEGEVYFLAGGTQTNAVVIRSLLKPYQGVLAAVSGHISIHEAGAVEAGGHKVMNLPAVRGKITAESVEAAAVCFEKDANRDHMVMPGMVYISQPTEYGTLYTRRELAAISAVCKAHGLLLYADGARLAYALASPKNDVSLTDLAGLCDIFYIGGTKCGALFGEAVVIPARGLIPHFFTLIKQQGALLAKGWVTGIQFDELFADGLYERIGAPAIQAAARLQEGLKARGCTLLFTSPTNQVFVILEDAQAERLGRHINWSFWEKPDEAHTIVRLATSWATRPEEVETLLSVFADVAANPTGEF